MTFDRWHLVEITDCFSSNFLNTYHALALFGPPLLTLHSSEIGLVLYHVFQKAYYCLVAGVVVNKDIGYSLVPIRRHGSIKRHISLI